MVALEDKLQEPKSLDGTRYTIKTKHFDEALKKVPPSVSIKVYLFILLNGMVAQYTVHLCEFVSDSSHTAMLNM